MKTNRMFNPSGGHRHALSWIWGDLWFRHGMGWWAFQLDNPLRLR